MRHVIPASLHSENGMSYSILSSLPRPLLPELASAENPSASS